MGIVLGCARLHEYQTDLDHLGAVLEPRTDAFCSAVDSEGEWLSLATR